MSVRKKIDIKPQVNSISPEFNLIQLYPKRIVTYWKRENGHWIVFEKHEDEQKARYFDYRFALFFSENMSAWFLYYDVAGHSIEAGQCERWEEEPSLDQVKGAVEDFLFKKAV